MEVGTREPKGQPQEEEALAWSWPDFQGEEPLLEQLKKALLARGMPELPEQAEEGQERYLEGFPSMSVENGLLQFVDPKTGVKRIVVPTTRREQVLQALHEPAHHGVKATRSRVKALFWWPSLGKDVESFVRQCETCDLHRGKHPST